MSPIVRLFSAAAITAASAACPAQGIPVIDAANLVQTVQQVVNDITKINNQVQQIGQLQSQLASMNGVRGLGTILDNPLLRNYVPEKAMRSSTQWTRRATRAWVARQRRCATPAWSTTAATWRAPPAPPARPRWPSPISTRACCRTR